MKKRLLTAALVLCLLLALMPAAAAYTPEDCVNYYGGHDWQQGAVVVHGNAGRADGSVQIGTVEV